MVQDHVVFSQLPNAARTSVFRGRENLVLSGNTQIRNLIEAHLLMSQMRSGLGVGERGVTGPRPQRWGTLPSSFLTIPGTGDSGEPQGATLLQRGYTSYKSKLAFLSDVEGVHTDHPATALIGLCPREATYMNKEPYSR